MRFKLKLEVGREKRKLPLNYQYELSAFIYKTLQRSNEEYANWLQENGFELNGRQFKLFTYSNFIIPQYKIEDDRILICCNSIIWFLTFLPCIETEKFIKGLLNEHVFHIGDRRSVVQFKVKNIDVVPPPEFSDIMAFKTLSPINISRKQEERKVYYVNPAEEYAKNALLKNLLNKYRVFNGKVYDKEIQDIDFDFKVLSDPKEKLILVKADTPNQTKIKGYNCKFLVKAPNDLMEIMHECGIGEKGSLGFGCIEVLRD